MKMKITLSYTQFQHGGQTNLGIWLMIKMPDGPCAFQVPEYMTDVDDAVRFWLMTTDMQNSVARLLERLGHTVERANVDSDDIRKEYLK
jgi:hypothetical protein